MAGRGPQTFQKRQKEQQRKEKQLEKKARKEERKRLGPEGAAGSDSNSDSFLIEELDLQDENDGPMHGGTRVTS
jgi:hypothetical protein